MNPQSSEPPVQGEHAKLNPNAPAVANNKKKSIIGFQLKDGRWAVYAHKFQLKNGQSFVMTSDFNITALFNTIPLAELPTLIGFYEGAVPLSLIESGDILFIAVRLSIISPRFDDDNLTRTLNEPDVILNK